MPFKMVILHPSVLPGVEQQGTVRIDIYESQELFLALRRHKPLKIVIAATAASGISFQFLKDRDQNFFHELRIYGQTVEEMIHTIILDNPDVPLQDILYVDKRIPGVQAAKRTGVVSCLMNPLGAPRINLGGKPVATWNVYSLLELPLVVGAQQPAY